MFTCVGAVGHTKTKVKIKAFEQFVPKIVFLDHSQSFDLIVTNCELHPVCLCMNIMELNSPYTGNMFHTVEYQYTCIPYIDYT